MNPKKKTTGNSLTGILMAVLLLPLLYVILWGLGGVLIVADGLQAADAVAVLSGNDADRLQEAARILQEGYATVVILTETGETPEVGRSMSTQEKFASAVALGIPPETIMVTQSSASSTLDEARAVRDLAQQQGFRKIIIVTDPYHCLRTRLLFRRTFSGTGVEGLIRPVRGHWYRSSTWWLSSNGRKVTMLEYSKLFLWVFGYRGD